MVVTLQRDADIGVITIDNPPVNATSHAVREGLMAAIRALAVDPALTAAVLCCAGRTFIAGADMREFGRPPVPPILPDVVMALEQSTKPIVAAIHGTALGGGLEIALGCARRIAVADARFGFPEVHVGVIPGAGATQRLPRLIGFPAAINLITSGKRIDAETARNLGLVDRVVKTDIKAAARDMAADLASARAPPRVPRNDPMTGGGVDWDIVEKDVIRAARGQAAPLRALEAIRAATTLSFDDGLANERRIFAACRDSREGRAMRHAFFAERRATSDDGDGQARPVTDVGVIGAGTMGRGIALCFASAGMPVTIVDRDPEALSRAREGICAVIDADVARSRIDAAEAADRKRLVHYASDYCAVAENDLVIEAVFEDATVKAELFAHIGPLLKPEAVLASNTSYLDIEPLAEASRRPASVVGLHFFSPAHLMKLVEVVAPPAADPETLATAFAIAKRIGKLPVRVGNAHGFIGNRIWSAYRRQADYLVADGALPWQVDQAMQNFGFRMGPFAALDLAGLDVGLAVRSQWRMANPHRRYIDLTDRLCAMGRVGQKAGAGWYRYQDGDRTPRPDPVVEQLLADCARESGLTRKPVEDETIVRHILVAMVNEACHVLAEGVAMRPSDIDVVMLNGYGFPRMWGGPLFWADEVGVDGIADALDAWATAQPADWSPAPMLREMADHGRRFADMKAD